MQIAELYQLQPGSPVSNLQAIVKNAYPPKPIGQYGGQAQTVRIADASGDIEAAIFDGPALQQGMQVMLTADAKGGCYTEVRQNQQTGEQKLRLTVKARVAGRVNILSGGTPAAPQGFPAQGQGWQQQAPQPLPAPPPQGSGQQGLAPFQGQQGGQQRPPTPAPQQAAWAPKAKMSVSAARAVLVSQFELIREEVEKSLGAAPNALEDGILAQCMVWATSILIGIGRGEIEPEKPAPAVALPPRQQGSGPEQWPGQVPPAQGWQQPAPGPVAGTAQGGGQGRWSQSDNMDVLPVEDDDIPF